MGRQIAEVFVQHQHKAHAVLRVEAQQAIDGFQGDRLRLRSESSRLAERAAKAAATRRKQNADRNPPASREAKLRNQRWMLNFFDRAAELPRQRLFAVTGE